MKSFLMKFGKQVKGQVMVSVYLDGKLVVKDWAPAVQLKEFTTTMKQSILEHVREQKQAK